MSEDRPDLKLVTAEDVEFATAQANEGAEEMEVAVWIPLATAVHKGSYNEFDVVLLHVVAHDPATKSEGAFVLVMGREEALDLRDKVNSVGATVSPMSVQIKRRTAAINEETK